VISPTTKNRDSVFSTFKSRDSVFSYNLRVEIVFFATFLEQRYCFCYNL